MFPSTPDARQEIPPTAGLPIRLRDLFPPRQGDFSERAAAFLGVPHAGIECSGTACLVVILETLRRNSRRTAVVVPAYTCPLVVFAVAACGLRLRLCDLARDSFELDPEALARTCDQDTLAVIPTHLGGRVAAIAPVAAIARRAGAFVIEDAAQAFGARQGGESVGLAGDAGFFSLAAGKGLSLYEGGIWVARDPQLRYEIARTSAEIVPSRPLFEAWRCLQLLGLAALYKPRLLRYAYGMPLRQALKRGDPVAAAGDHFSSHIPLHRVSAWRRSIGSCGLARLPGFQAALAAQAAARLPRLARLKGVRAFADGPGGEGTWPVLTLTMASAAQRDAALRELWGSGYGVARMFAHALPDYDYLRPWVEPQAYPNARDFAARSFTISNSPWLDDARFEAIVAVLERHAQ